MPDIDYLALAEVINRNARDRLRDARGRFVSGTEYQPACGVDQCRQCPRVDLNGYDRDGYDRNGYNADGWNRRGYDRDGYDRDGYNIVGYDRNNRDRDGYDIYGCDRNGYNRAGWNREGRRRDGSRYVDGYDIDGFDEAGYNRDGYDRDGYDRDGYDSDGYDSEGLNEYGERRSCGCGYRDCEDCYPDSRRLRNYSYTPTLKFRGDSGPYFGMEIEVTTDRIGRFVDVVEEHDHHGLIYCKEDGSVAGVEMVTHPMSYDWAMANFPWQLLPDLRKRADADVIASDNGIHIHVSRDGFSNSAHLYRWMKFWYRNPSDMQRIARRRAESWGAFRPDHRSGQFEHVKRDKPGYDRRADTTLSRYSAINTTNDETLEVRLFASTLRPQRAQAALQLVAATVEYTRQLSADAITHRRGWDWSAFMAWTRKSGKYGALVAEDHIRRYL